MILLTRGERLKDLRTRNGLSLERLQKDVDISKTVLGEYENEKKEPSAANLRRLAEYYNVSVDYLVGKSKYPEPDINTRAISERTGLNDHTIKHLEWMQNNRRDDREYDLIDLINHFAGLGRSDMAIAISALVRIPKRSKTAEQEILEQYYLGNFYTQALQLVDMIRDDLEKSEQHRERLRELREIAKRKMEDAKEAATNGDHMVEHGRDSELTEEELAASEARRRAAEEKRGITAR
jgi:transcriptional regulator with XRE-family HTH domain